jgi:CRP-like cAMP-binding protein
MPDLRDHYLFAGLSEAQLRGLWPYIHARDLPAGQTLFSQDDEATSFFLLEHGAVALYRVSAEGQEKVMRFIQPGQTFAESVMFMADSRYPVHARATQASRVLAIDAAAYLKIMEASFATCRSVLARMTERIQAHWDEIEALSLQNSRYRIVHYLLGLAPATASGDVTITLPARKALIAAQLAVTPETLSRILHALAEDRLIEMQGYRLRIPNVAALCRQIS